MSTLASPWLRCVVGGWILLGLAAVLDAQIPTITAQPARWQVVDLGQSLTLYVTATGTPAPTYQWLHNGRPVAGATTASCTIAQAAMQDSGWYQVVVTNSSGSATSTVGFVNVAVDVARIVAWGGDFAAQAEVPAGLSRIAAVAGGKQHSLALKGDGTVVGWGENRDGQATVPADLAEVVAVAAGASYHSLALRSDGTVAAWGYNGHGETNVPAGLANVVAIAAGDNHSLALKSDGSVVAWGLNGQGQTTLPAGLANVVGVTAGAGSSYALKSDGTVVGWGGAVAAPAGLNGVAAIAAGPGHCLALKDDGTVAAWGRNDCGQATVPGGLTGVAAIAAGGDYSLALKRDGTVVAWGAPTSYNWGQATVPAGLSNIVSIASGVFHGLALKNDAPPTIVTPPAGQAVSPGQGATLRVSATGSGLLTYQWRKGPTTLVDGGNLAGTSTASLTIGSVSGADIGSYTVTVSNGYGSATSEAATLTTTALPVITAISAPRQVVTLGQNLTLSVTATSGTTMAFQWRHNGVPVAGATTGSLTLPGAAVRDQGWYQVVVSNGSGATTSPAVYVGVATNPAQIVAWGADAGGETAVPVGLTDVTAVSGGCDRSLALRSDGTVVTWGKYVNYSIQPRLAPGLSNVVAIAAGYEHDLALKDDGTVVAWGWSGSGQAAVPPGLTQVVAIAAGLSHSLALKSDGTVVAWGNTSNGICAVPAGLSNVVAIAAGSYQSLALKSDGTVVGWGRYESGPATVPAGLVNVTAIGAGWNNGLALKSDGTVAVWGDNLYGQTTPPAGLSNVVAVAAGRYNGLALKSDGTVVAWGDRSSGQNAVPANLSYVGSIAAGMAHALALRRDITPRIATMTAPRQVVNLGQSLTLGVTATGVGTLIYEWRRCGLPIPGATASSYAISSAAPRDKGWYQVVVSNAYGSITSPVVFVNVAVNPAQVVGWGSNGFGQTTVPGGLTAVAGIAAGRYHSLALKADGTLAAWGTSELNASTLPANASDVVEVAAGAFFSLALKSDGTVSGAGSNTYGETTVPAGLTDVVALAAGGHSLALRSNGTVVAWGYNGYGETAVPAGLGNVVAVAAGGNHSLALKSDGTVTAWGRNSYGQTTVPAGLNNVVMIDAGYDYNLALKSDGTVVAWGDNSAGQRNLPANLTGVVAIAAGDFHAVALKNDGTVVAWGFNEGGESTVPVGLANVVGLAGGGRHTLAVREATADTLPTLSGQPASQAAEAGSSITLTVTATGHGAFTYQWMKGTTLLADGGNISGATTAALTLAPVSAADSGAYTCVVTSSVGGVSSEEATLTVVSSNGRWVASGGLGTARGYHTATRLPGGKVLIAGGTGTTPLASAELYDPVTGVFTPTGNMGTAHTVHTATLLPNGKVLIAGGDGATSTVTNGAELYDPATGTFTVTGSLITGRSAHTATLLPGGKVLLAGGASGSYAATASAELYDLATGTFIPTGSMGTIRSQHTATLLPNGKVLMAGGGNWSAGILGSAELYDPATGTFAPTGSMGTVRYTHTATLLPSGKVLIIGGGGQRTTYTPQASAELYDPVTGTFTPTGSMITGRTFMNLIAASLPGGKVLVVGGSNGAPLASAELYDPATGIFAAKGSLAAARNGHSVTLLADGDVLIAGGQVSPGPLASAELYDVDPPAAPLGLSYRDNPAIYTRGVLIVENTPSSGGGAVASYAVSPALPTGLSLNTTTGAISGTPTAIAAASDFAVTATNSGGTATASVRITVVEPPSPPVLTVTVPPPGILMENQAGSVASVPDQPAMSFTWMIQGGAITSGQGTRSITFTAGSAGTLSLACTAANAAGATATSATTTLTVNAVPAAPAVTTPPVSQAAALGTSATFSVAASGDNLAYQWFKTDATGRRTAIPGATTASLTIESVQSADWLVTYSVTVSNPQTSVSSSEVTLLPPTPVIVDQPVACRVPAGGAALFRVAAVGAGSLSYQWCKDGNALAGATAADLALSPLVAADGATYSVVVTNGAGAATSSGAVLTVLPPDPLCWQQLTEGSTAQAPSRTVHDGLGGVYLPWNIYSTPLDMLGGRFVGPLVRLREGDGMRDPDFQLPGWIHFVNFTLVLPDGRLLLAVGADDAQTVIRTDATGVVDATFTAPQFACGIRFLTRQPDGRIIVVATDNFNSDAPAAALAAGGVYRLEADGALDSSFTPAVLDGTVLGPLALDAANRIYVAGRFTTVNGVARPGMARLNSDGALDIAFADPATLPAGFTLSQQARGMGIQSDGRVVVIGGFRYAGRGSNSDRIVAIRFNADGTYDSSFAQPLRSTVGLDTAKSSWLRAMIMQGDKFVAVADRLVRFNADGSIDPSFQIHPFSRETFWVSRGADGRLYVPDQTGVVGAAALQPLWGNGVAVFAADGAPDFSFQTGGWGRGIFPFAAQVLSDGRVWLAGEFNRVGGRVVPGIAQFTSAGALSGTQAVLGPGSAPVALPGATVAEAGNDQTFVLWGDTMGNGSGGLARLNADGSVDGTFSPQMPANYPWGSLADGSLSAAPGGRVLVVPPVVPVQAAFAGTVGDTLLRLNADGSRDTGFVPAVANLSSVQPGTGGALTAVKIGSARVAQVLTDGRVLLIAGTVDGHARLWRLNTDGSPDGTWAASSLGRLVPSAGYAEVSIGPAAGATELVEVASFDAAPAVRAALQMSDGRIYVGGALNLAGAPRGLVRLAADGSLDATFTGAGLEYVARPDARPLAWALATDASGRVYVAGRFDRYDGHAVPGLFRLRADGTFDADWNPGAAVLDYPAVAVGLRVMGTKLYVFGTVGAPGDAFPGMYRVLDIVPPPTVTGFTPATITAGMTVTLTGTNFTGAAAVRFNGVEARSFKVNSNTQITAVVPNTLLTGGPITVTTGGGTGASGTAFVYSSAPIITGQPADSAVTGGAYAILTVTAFGPAPLSYQWQRDGMPIAGATESAYIIDAAQSGDADSYRVVVSAADSGASTTSEAARLTILPYTPYAINTLAGQASSVSTDGSMAVARFNVMYGIAIDAAGNLYVADTFNHTVREITTAGTVTTLAGRAGAVGSADGTGSAARFAYHNGIAVDAAGNVYVADSSSHTIRKIAPGGVVTTWAGAPGVLGNVDGNRTAARFNLPWAVDLDRDGNLYVTEYGNHTIRKITPAGLVTTLAGKAGETGAADGTGSAARFYSPRGLAVDAAGVLHVADSGNNTIRTVTPAGVVTTVAGLAGTMGSADGTGTAARFRGSHGVAVDLAGNVYVAEANNSTIRKVTPAGVVTTLAGTAGVSGFVDARGSAARFMTPTDVVVDGAGNLYVTERGNNAIRRITPEGDVTTVAGQPSAAAESADGTGRAARFAGPADVAVDASGIMYVADGSNHTIRKITPSGVVTTFAGLAGSPGSADGSSSAARFNSPSGVAVDATGIVYVADTNNHTIRKIAPDGTVTTLAGSAGLSGPVDGTGDAARFSSPAGVAVDFAGNVIVADTVNQTLRKITPAGVVSTLAGSVHVQGLVDGVGTAARFYNPWGVEVDQAGNVYVADRTNGAIRKVTPDGTVTTLVHSSGLVMGVAVDGAGAVYATCSSGFILSVAPGGALSALAGMAGVAGSADGVGAAALFSNFGGVALDSAGNIAVADYGNNTIRVGWPAASAPPLITTQPASRTVDAGANVTFTVEASGTGLLTYQWFKGETAISGATGTSLTISNVSTADAGRYTVTVGRGLRTATSTPATLALSGPGPTVQSVVRTTPTVTLSGGDANVTWRVNFSEGVTGVDAGDFVLTTTGSAAGVISAVSGAGATWWVTVSPVTGTGSLRLDLKAGDTGILGTSGHALTCGFALGEAYQLTRSPAAVVWGSNNFGQLGNDPGIYQTLPVAVDKASENSALAGKTVIAIANGYYHSLALTSDGRVYAWGLNESGQLGDGSTTTRSTPRAVHMSGALAGKTVVAISAGTSYSVALTSEGKVFAWGLNNNGQLGNNSAVNSFVPVAVNVDSGTSALAGKTVTAIAAGSAHVLALSSEGLVYAWGANFAGSLGNNMTSRSLVPVAVNVAGGTSALAGKTVTAIAAGSGHSLALASDGTLCAWGDNLNGQLGNSSTTSSSVPVAVSVASGVSALAGKTVTAIAAGGYHSLALTSDGLLCACGYNRDGQLGIDSTTDVLAPVAVNASGGGGALAGRPVTAISGGLNISLARMGDGTLYAWGNNSGGQLGIGSTFSSRVPVAITGGALADRTVTVFAGGGWHASALTSDGTLCAWGQGGYGQLGDGVATFQNEPAPVITSGALTGKAVVAVAVGASHSLALTSDGLVYAWGHNGYGRLGDDSMAMSAVPVAVSTTGALAGKRVVAVAAGSTHSLALASDGTAYAWGHNANGQLGNNSTTNSAVPVAVDRSGVLAGKTLVAIAAGNLYSLALASDGTVYTWGYNANGRLGNNSTTDSPVPVAVNTTSGTSALYGKVVTAIAAGYSHALALTSDSLVCAWGLNGSGQLGSGSTTQSLVPVAVSTASGTSALSGKTVTAIAAGGLHSLALVSDGTVCAWGQNTFGQLGDYSMTSRTVPVVVDAVAGHSDLAGKTVTAIAAGYSHSLALTTEGKVYAWGSNLSGQWGNGSPGTTTDTAVAVNATGPLAGSIVYALGAGSASNHCLVVALSVPTPVGLVAASGSYGLGAPIDITVTFSSPVVVDTTGGVPYFGLTIGDTPVAARYESGSGTATLVFRYTVAAGDTDADGIEGSPAITLNGGTIRDNVGTSANPSVEGVEAGNIVILVDTTAPARPAAPTTTTPTTSNPRPTITGTAEAGSAVRLFDGTTLIGTALAEAVTGAWSITPAAALGNGAHSLTVTATDLAGNASAASPALVVIIDTDGPPVIIKPPVGRVVGIGTGVTFTVEATGRSLSYRWKKAGSNLIDGGRVSGATTATLSIAAVTLGDAGVYSVVVSNAAGSVILDGAVLFVVDCRGLHGIAGSGYLAGGTVTIANAITYAETQSGLGWQVVLPAGWSYGGGGGNEGDVKPAVGDTNLLEWAWTTIPSSPVTFTYTLNVPAGTVGVQTLVAVLVGRQDGLPYTMVARPDPLVLERVSFHTADLNEDGKLALNELLRVIELFNTRNGTVRTGAYGVDAGNLEDGFARDFTRGSTEVVLLARCHAADLDHDGKLSLPELLRVIELYNYRAGTVRIGQYHLQPGTEDGFGAGP